MPDLPPTTCSAPAIPNGSLPEALLDQLPVGLLVVDAASRVLRLNQRAAAWWGQPPTAQGQLLGQLGAGHLPAAAYAALQLAATGQPTPGRYWLPAAGQWLALTGTAQPTGEVVVHWQDATAQAAAANYQALLAATDEGFCRLELLADAQGAVVDYRFLEVNHVFEQQMRAGVVGQRGSELVPAAAAHWLIAFRQVAQTGQPVHTEYYEARTDRWYATCAVQAGEQGSNHVCLLFNDITARKQAEAATQENEARQAFLLHLSDALRPLADPVAVQEAITHTALAFFGADRCYYCEVAAGEAIIQRDAVRGALPSMAGTYALSSFPLLQMAFDHGEPLVVPDVHTSLLLNEPLRQHCGQLQVGALVKVPVTKHGQPVGALCVMQSTPRAWTALEVELAQEVAERTWAAVERARAETALRASEAKYRTLFESLDEGYALLELLYDDAGQVTDGLHLEVNAAQKRLTGLPNSAGKRISDLLPYIEPDWLALYGRVAATGQPERLEQYAAGLGCWFSGHASRVGGAGSRLIAVVFSDITARKRHEASQALLMDVSHELMELTDTAATMQRLGAKIGQHFGVQQCLLAEPSENYETAYVIGWHADTAQPLAGSYRIRDYFSTEHFEANRRGELTIVADTQADPHVSAANYQALGVRAVVAVPLVRAGQWRFTLSVLHPAPRAWRPDEVDLLHELASRIWTRLERARAEEALRTSEEQFRLFMTTSPDTLYRMSADWQQMLTLEGHNFLADTLAPSTTWLESYIPATDQPAVQLAIEAAIAAVQPFELEHRVYQADGTVGWILSRAVPVLAENGQIREWFGAATDITARKHAEQALRESEAQLAALNQQLEQQVADRTRELAQSRDQLQSVFDTSLIALSVMEAVRDETGEVIDFRLLLVSRELERQTGRRDLVGKGYKQEYPDIVAAGLYDLALRTLATGEPQSLEYHYSFAGSRRWFASQFVKLNGGVVATNLDITERKQAEQELRKNLRLLEQAEKMARLGSWVDELATGELRWSRGMYRLFNLEPGTLVQPEIYLAYVVPADRPVARRIVQALTTHPTDLEETLHLQVGSEVRTVRLKAVLLRDAAGQPTRLLGVDLDISREQQLETDNLLLRLNQQQALFAAVQEAQEEERRRIAESLHNGLGQLLYASKIQLDCLPPLPDEPARREATRLLSEAIRQTRALSHELTPALLEEFGLEAALQRICRTLSSAALRWHCHLALDEEPPLPPALQLAVYRLAQELAQNVVKHAHAHEATLEVEILPAWLVLRVEDNGWGFDPATTSDGLGLRTLRSRVALLGGSVHLTTAPGQGTQCQVRLPLTSIPI